MNKTKLKSENGSFSGNNKQGRGEFQEDTRKARNRKFNTFMVSVLITQLICSISNLQDRYDVNFDVFFHHERRNNLFGLRVCF